MGSLSSGYRVGRYTLGPLAGRGGIAEVYEIVGHPGLVLKVLANGLQEDEDSVLRFSREAELQAQVRSPHVAAVRDEGQSRGCPYFVMERREGTLLAAYLDTDAAIDDAVCVEVLSAVRDVHLAGITHRDIKADNFLWDGSRGTLLDFGMATPQRQGVRVRTQLGSPAAWGPERLDGFDGADPRSDLFSAGLLLYQIVARAHPFGFGDGAWKENLRTGEVPPLRAFKPQASALDRFFERALASALDDRFQCAEAMMAAWKGDLASAR